MVVQGRKRPLAAKITRDRKHSRSCASNPDVDRVNRIISMKRNPTKKITKINFILSAIAIMLLTWGTTQAAGNMRAAVIVNGKVEMQNVPVPEPQSGQVRVKVRAAGVNPVDWKLAAFNRGPGLRIAGRDLAGVIDAVGPSTEGWHVGDAVIGVAARGSGSYAEYALVSVKAIAHKPTGMSFEEAAGMPVVGETAWRAIVTVGNVQHGQKVLIHGGAGGVGSSAVQVARARGAFIIATASPRNNDFLKTLGVNDVIDYHTTRFEDKVSGLDLVLNTVNTDYNERSIGVLKPGGVLISIVGPPPAQKCEASNVRCGVTGTATGEMLPHVVELANAGKFRVNIDHKMPLEQANAAWDLNRAGHTRGKIILVVSQ